MNGLQKRAKKEVSTNYDYFQTQLPELMQTHFGKFALLHKKEIIEFFDTIRDAARYGMMKFGEGNYSVQQVAKDNVRLGWQGYVLLT